MILALCSTGKELSSDVDVRFGRASFFIFFNTENSEFKVIENSAKNAVEGAGSSAVQLLVDNETEVLIAPEVGPLANEALIKFSIPAYLQGDTKTVNDAINAWKKEKLELVEKAGNKGLHKA